MFFNRYINVCFINGIRSFRVQTWEKPCKKAVFMFLFPREIQGIKWENGNFLSEVK